MQSLWKEKKPLVKKSLNQVYETNLVENFLLHEGGMIRKKVFIRKKQVNEKCNMFCVKSAFKCNLFKIHIKNIFHWSKSYT